MVFPADPVNALVFSRSTSSVEGGLPNWAYKILLAKQEVFTNEDVAHFLFSMRTSTCLEGGLSALLHI